MEKWHKIGIFVVGLIGLVSYLYGSAKKVSEDIREASSREKKEVPPKKKTIRYQIVFLAAVIAAMFIIPKLLGDIITYVFPHPEKTSMELLMRFLKGLVYLGKEHFGNEAYFFEGQGLMILEWVLVLSPYIIGFMIWSIRIAIRNVRA